MDERSKQILALGREHYEKREFDKAEHFLRQCLERDVRFADVLNMMGVIAHDRGQLEEAQQHFEEALRVNPNYTEAALNLSVTYNDVGRYDDAKRIYQAAMEHGEESPGKLDPFVMGKIANLHVETAQGYTDVGLISEAMHELRKALLLCPHFADVRVKLANLYQQQGDPAAAVHELKEAIKHRESYVPAHVALGVVQLGLGETAAARRAWARAVELDPGHKAAQMYLRMLDAQQSG
ncbi:MAG: tetratricopeptide repeat protein [Polyangiales bacterium]|nr:tetratricopeptide repeat protein [Myxococcales bacterium]MCB9657595.1 tetratricopeptide repeat protein [Sandaracinaceae bacterium]